MKYRSMLPVLLIMIAVLSFACQFLFNIVLSHVLKGGLYGNFNVAIQTFFLFSLLLLLGTSSAAENFLAKYLKENDSASAEDYIRWNFRLIWKSSKWFMAFLVALALSMLILHVFDIKNLRTYHISFYLLFLAPLGALTSLLVAYLQCNRNIITYNLLSQCGWSVVYTLVIGSFFYLYHPLIDNMMLLSLTFIVLLLLFCMDYIIFYLKFPRDIVRSLLDFEKSPTIASGKWRKTAYQLCVDQIIYAIICVIGLYAIKFFTTDPLAIDQYSAILAIVNVFNLFSSSIYSIITPNISFNLANKKNLKVQTLVNRCNLSNFLTATIVLLFIVYFGHTFLGYFGARYVTEDGYWALIILAAGSYVCGFSYVPFFLLAYSGNQKWPIYISTGQFVILAILATFLTMHFGIIGAAIATTLATILQTVVSSLIARSKTHIKALTFV